MLQFLFRTYRKKQNPRRVRTYANDVILRTLWIQTRQRYFPDRADLDTYTTCWSPRRQKRVLGSCNLHKRHVMIAQELKDPEYASWLEPLVYHEMCHAYLGLQVEKFRGKRRWHGPEFKALERRHPLMQEFNAWIKAGGWREAVRRGYARQSL